MGPSYSLALLRSDNLALAGAVTFLGSLAIVNAIVLPCQRAQRTSIYFVCLLVGNVAPVLATGLLADFIGLVRAVYVFAGFVCIAAAFLFHRFRRGASPLIPSRRPHA